MESGRAWGNGSCSEYDFFFYSFAYVCLFIFFFMHSYCRFEGLQGFCVFPSCHVLLTGLSVVWGFCVFHAMLYWQVWGTARFLQRPGYLRVACDAQYMHRVFALWVYHQLEASRSCGLTPSSRNKLTVRRNAILSQSPQIIINSSDDQLQNPKTTVCSGRFRGGSLYDSQPQKKHYFISVSTNNN